MYDDEEKEFVKGLEPEEKTGFDILVAIRNGELTPIEAFKKVTSLSEGIPA